MKIYTKTGDTGTTVLFGGRRVDKNSARIEAYGNVDELNSLLGMAIADTQQADILKKVTRIQGELFVLGGDLSAPIDLKIRIPRITKSYVTRLEKEIDILDKSLAPLRNFILPGGSNLGSKLHLARTVTRRAERRIAELANTEKINKFDIMYINRLSDWLFVLARYANKLENKKETVWRGRGK